MKKIFNTLLVLAVLLGLQSCTDETIGTSLTDTRSAIIEDSSFVLTGHSVLNQRVQARTSTQLVGLLKADGYGTLSSEVVTQFIPAALIDTMGVSSEMIDSCRLMLAITGDGFTGDSKPPMRLKVYRLNKQLPSPLYSDFDPTGYYDEDDLLGSTAYSPLSTTTVYQESGGQTYSYEAVFVPMPVSLARDIHQEYRQHPETFSSPSAFAKFFPGIYICNSYGSGRVMNFNKTELQVFYRKASTTPSRAPVRPTWPPRLRLCKTISSPLTLTHRSSNASTMDKPSSSLLQAMKCNCGSPSRISSTVSRPTLATTWV